MARPTISVGQVACKLLIAGILLDCLFKHPYRVTVPLDIEICCTEIGVIDCVRPGLDGFLYGGNGFSVSRLSKVDCGRILISDWIVRREFDHALQLFERLVILAKLSI